ncbi:hypothetical protein RIF29_07716 [Crotalaria pallida]|uniref:Uncharacterized protein n=1 Tax=Crotalaria pallida TaxID=3830 RepID=A0AAN9J4M2_CROPI
MIHKLTSTLVFFSFPSHRHLYSYFRSRVFDLAIVLPLFLDTNIRNRFNVYITATEMLVSSMSFEDSCVTDFGDI